MKVTVFETESSSIFFVLSASFWFGANPKPQRWSHNSIGFCPLKSASSPLLRSARPLNISPIFISGTKKYKLAFSLRPVAAFYESLAARLLLFRHFPPPFSYSVIYSRIFSPRERELAFLILTLSVRGATTIYTILYIGYVAMPQSPTHKTKTSPRPRKWALHAPPVQPLKIFLFLCYVLQSHFFIRPEAYFPLSPSFFSMIVRGAEQEI